MTDVYAVQNKLVVIFGKTTTDFYMGHQKMKPGNRKYPDIEIHLCDMENNVFDQSAIFAGARDYYDNNNSVVRIYMRNRTWSHCAHQCVSHNGKNYFLQNYGSVQIYEAY